MSNCSLLWAGCRGGGCPRNGEALLCPKVIILVPLPVSRAKEEKERVDGEEEEEEEGEGNN